MRVPIANYGVGAASANGAYTVASGVSDLTTAIPGATIEIRDDISLSGDITIPEIKIVFTKGKIILNGFSITGTNTSFIYDDDEVLFEIGAAGQLLGTWNPPEALTTNMFGHVPDGELKLGAGNITASGTTFTDPTAQFDNSYVGKTITIVGAGQNADAGQPDNYVLTATVDSVTNGTTIELDTPAINTASNANYIIGTDNANMVDQALRMMNRKDNVGLFIGSSKGTLATSSYDRNPNLTLRPVGWTIGDGTDGHMVVISGDIQLFAHDISDSQLLTTWRTKNCSVMGLGGRILGDYKTVSGEPIYTSQNGKGEHNHGVCWFSLSVNTKFDDLFVYGFYGDAFYGQGDSQFMNQIDGVNRTDASTDSGVSIGYIDDTGVIDGANTDFAYTTDLLPLTGSQFDNITSLGLQRWFMVTGSSFGNWAGLANPDIYIAYYDEAGTFQEITQRLSWFQRIYVPKESFTQARVMFKNPDTYGGSTADVEMTLRPDLHSFGGHLINSTAAHCGRQGLSNGPSDFLIKNNFFFGIGGLAAGPGFGIDYEDGGRIKQNIRIIGNKFENNWGGITLKGPENVIVANNYVKGYNFDISEAPTNKFHAGISMDEGRNARGYGNIIEFAAVSVGRNGQWHDNWHKNEGILQIKGNGSVIKNNIFENTTIWENDGDYTRAEHRTQLIGNTHLISQKMEDYLFKVDNNSFDLIDHTIQYNWVGNWETDREPSDNDIVLGASFLGETVNRQFLRGTMTTDYGGIVKGLKVFGLNTISDTSSGNGEWLYTDYTDCEAAVPMEFGDGLPKEITHKNCKYFSWHEYDLSQFADVLGGSGTPVISYIGGVNVIRNDNVHAWANGGSNILTTAAKDAALYSEDHEWRVEVPFTLTGNFEKFMDLNHFGPSDFIRCRFYVNGPSNYQMDLTNTTMFGASGGDFTFVDQKFGGTFDPINPVILDTGDRMLFTIPNQYTKTYATHVDDAAAIAAGVPVGYCYFNSTLSNYKWVE